MKKFKDRVKSLELMKCFKLAEKNEIRVKNKLLRHSKNNESII